MPVAVETPLVEAPLVEGQQADGPGSYSCVAAEMRRPRLPIAIVAALVGQWTRTHTHTHHDTHTYTHTERESEREAPVGPRTLPILWPSSLQLRSSLGAFRDAASQVA